MERRKNRLEKESGKETEGQRKETRRERKEKEGLSARRILEKWKRRKRTGTPQTEKQETDYIGDKYKTKMVTTMIGG